MQAVLFILSLIGFGLLAIRTFRVLFGFIISLLRLVFYVFLLGGFLIAVVFYLK